MKRWIKITAGAGLATLAGASVLGVRQMQFLRQWRQTEVALQTLRTDAAFDPAMLDGLPGPAQRYFRHAIAEDTPLARTARIDMAGRMKPSPDAGFLDLAAEEVLAPPAGFQWTARFSMGPLPICVRDHYYRNDGAVRVEPLGLVPLQRSSGPEVTRSSRHRLAAEALWIPATLLPGPAVQWEAIDERRARVTMTIDDEAIPLTLTIDDDGRLQQFTMQRYGDVNVPTWQRIPYGFAVEEEATFGGYTIPSRLRGGWWFGTDRYRADQASSFTIRAISYR